MRKMTKLLKEERKAAHHWFSGIGSEGKPRDLKDFDTVKNDEIARSGGKGKSKFA